ncbi:IclR family transcriptional regulator [Pigmentiphaga soli]|uniref:IclR family transcriptional regulator n=1 Tax=Pigmentiphaga soli TaxID=1007095 RepID=A0ABP8HNA9_9BURK
MKKRTEPATVAPAAERNGGTQVLERAFALLRTLSSRPRSGWKLTELSESCGLHHATTHRLLAALMREGMVTRDAVTRRYALGRLAFEFGIAACPQYDWRAACAPALDDLARVTGDTVFLNVRSGHESVCIDRREGSYPLKALTVEIGARRPLCVSAGGAAILGRLPPEEMQAALAASEKYMQRFDAPRAAAVQRMLTESRRLGYGYNREMIIPGVRAVGVAIAGADGWPQAALSIAAIASRLDGSRRTEIVELLRRHAGQLGQAIAAGTLPEGTPAFAGR